MLFRSRHAFPDLAPGEVPRLCAGAVAYPHAEVLRPEDLFALAEGALAQGKADNTGGIGLAEPGKAPGERVLKGQVVGHVGGGSSDQGPHLHFEIRGRGGIALDPVNWLKSHR